MKVFTRSRDDRGATMVEYGLITSLISLLSFSAVTLVGDSTEESFDQVATAIEHSPGGGGGPVETPGGGSDGGGSDPTTTTTAPSSPTTTSAPPTTTTTAPTTTTTAPTTTTTAPTTTTTTAATPIPGGSTPQATGSEAEVTSWKTNKNGGSGKWAASVSFENTWSADQLLTLEVTEIQHDGTSSTRTVKNFKVPAGSSATFSDNGNSIAVAKGATTGVMQVQVRVTSIKTTDANGETATYPQTDPAATIIDAPATP